MLQYDFEASVGYWLITAHQAYTRSFQQALAPYGITFRQAQVLAWLAAEGPQSQTELAERMLIEPPNLVGVLDRMEEAGLVERRPCPDDGRRKLVCPLPAAEETWRLVAACGRSIRERATEGISPGDLTRLKNLLNKLRANLLVDEPVRP